MQNIGLVNYTGDVNSCGGKDGEPTKFNVIDRYCLFMDADTEVGKTEDSQWIAQTICLMDDDFAVIKMYFDHKPTARDLETAFAVRNFERRPVEVFRCWECGHLTHWLEFPGAIEMKIAAARERCCDYWY